MMRAGNPDAVDHVIEAVRTGRSAAVVLQDERVPDWPDGFRVTLTAGAASEVDVRGGGVHQLCVQLLDQVERLSSSQREVLRRAFDPSAPEQDPSAVALTLFSLLATAAEAGPVICLVRDPGLLDRFSLAVLALTARRLVSESVALLFRVEDDVPEELVGVCGVQVPRDPDAVTVTAG